MYDFMFWSGVAAWIAVSAIGTFFAIDEIAYRLIDSVKFKFWLAQYLRSQQKSE